MSYRPEGYLRTLSRPATRGEWNMAAMQPVTQSAFLPPPFVRRGLEIKSRTFPGVRTGS